MPALPPATPCGRSELLAWINTLCSAQYPTVESLRDGAGYCTIIEAAASRLSKNCAAAGFPDYHDAASKAAEAKILLAKVDWTATSHTYDVLDPAMDPGAIRQVCVKNMNLLQKMLFRCMFPEFSQKIEATRLAEGKRQEHLQFLHWLCSFIRKVLTQYTKSELGKKFSPDDEHAVEGVKMNRTVILRKRQHRATSRSASLSHARAESSHPSPRNASQTTTRTRSLSSPGTLGLRGASSATPRVATSSERRETSLASSGGEEAMTHRGVAVGGQSRSREARGDDETKKSSSSRRDERNEQEGGGDRLSSVSPRDHHQLTTQRHAETERRGGGEMSAGAGRHMTSTSPSPGGGRGDSSERAAVMSNCSRPPNSLVTIPEEWKARAIETRQRVEALESLIMSEHTSYQSCLVVPPLRGDEASAAAAPNDRVISLTELGALLEERDTLAQVYLEVERVLRRHVEHGVSTPLLMQVCSVLYPTLDNHL